MPQHTDWGGKFFLNRQTKCQDRESLRAELQELGLCIRELKEASQQLFTRVVKGNPPRFVPIKKRFYLKGKAPAGSGISTVGLALLLEPSPGLLLPQPFTRLPKPWTWAHSGQSPLQDLLKKDTFSRDWFPTQREQGWFVFAVVHVLFWLPALPVNKSQFRCSCPCGYKTNCQLPKWQLSARTKS